MKKTISILLVTLFLISMLSACGDTTSKAFTFEVDTGDSIKISLDTSDNYDLSSELPFSVSCNGEVLTQGTFVLGEAYEQYVGAVDSDEKAELLDSGTKDGNEYVFWCYDGSEYNYAVLIGNSSTGVILGNAISEESARECFERLTISLGD